GTKTEPRYDLNVEPLTPPYGNSELGYRDLVDFNHDGWPDLLTGNSIQLNDGLGAPMTCSKIVTLKGAGRIKHLSDHGDPWEERIMADLAGEGRPGFVIGDQ